MNLVSVGRTWVGDDSLNEFVYATQVADVSDLKRKWAAFLADL